MFETFFRVILQRRTFSLLLLLEIGLAYVIYQNVFLINKLTSMPILDMEFGYSIDRVNEILGAYSPEAWARYEIIQIADIIHPAVYASLIGALIWVMADGERWRWLALLALATALFDWGENVMIWRMTSANLPVDAVTAEMSNVLSILKHSLLALTFVALLLMFLRRLGQALFY
ncbi:MAG: hypothetical protein AAF393_18405 [Pseudomonadota bacterium]